MPFVTHFKDTDGQQLPIAASTLVTVEIPAAGSADKGGWMQAAQDTTEHYNQQAGHDAPKNSAVLPSCTDPSVFTDHGLRIEYEEQLQGWVLWIDSLPAEACTLTLLFINHSTEGTPCALPALGVGGGGEKVIDLTKYADAIGTSFNNILLSLFLTGGGEANAQGGDQFWTDINTDGRVKFVIDASSIDAGVTVECEAKSIIKRNGKTVSIETSFLLHSVEKVMVTLYFGWFDGGTAIIVAVETLNLPS